MASLPSSSSSGDGGPSSSHSQGTSLSSSSSSSSTPSNFLITRQKELQRNHLVFLRCLRNCGDDETSQHPSTAVCIEKEDAAFRRLHTSSKSRRKREEFAFLQQIREHTREGNVDKVLKKGARQFLSNIAFKELVRELDLTDALNQLQQKHLEECDEARMHLNLNRRLPLTDGITDECSVAADSREGFSTSSSGGGFYDSFSSQQSTDIFSQDVMGVSSEHQQQADDDAASDAMMLNFLENELLPDSIGTVVLSEAQLAILSSSTNAPKFDIGHPRLMQHFAVAKLWPHEDINAYLAMMRALGGVQGEKFPKSSKTFLKIDPRQLGKTRIRNIYPRGPGIRRRHISGRDNKTATYLHLGLKNALLGKSCGLVYKWQYVNTMRTVYSLFPDFIPQEILELIRPQPGEELDRDILKHWGNLPRPPTDSVGKTNLVFRIHAHIDGVQWFNNSTQSKGVPILGRLVSIEDQDSKKMVKIPELQPFIIGVLHILKQTDTKAFVKDFVEELRELRFPQVSNLSFKVNIYK